MPIPPNATPFTQPMDPVDLVDYQITLSQGSNTTDFLQPGEGVASYTLALTAEATAAGLTINTTSPYATTLTGTTVKFWLTVASGSQASTSFNGAGLTLGLELTVTTNAVPPRIKQRTYTVTVANQ